MAYEPKDGSGSLFRNEKKSERAPDYRGEAMIGGTVYELAGWKKQTKSGDTFLSLAVKPKEERHQKEEKAQYVGIDDGSDVPF